jgi:hypothetical protein
MARNVGEACRKECENVHAVRRCGQKWISNGRNAVDKPKTKMQIKVTVKESETFAARMAQLRSLSGTVMMQAGRDVAQWLRQYHVRFRQKWQGDRYMQGPRSNLFWQSVVAGWQDPVVSGKRVTITNTFGLLSWKVSGGTISPIRAQRLTIPLVPEAKGLTAAEWKAEEGLPLFRVGNALMTRVGKRLVGIYALSESVTQAPWPGAMPPDEQIKQVFADSARQQIRNIAKQ